MHYLKKYPFSWALVIFIFIICLLPVPETPVDEVPGIDKLVHTGMYGFLCLVVMTERLRQVKHRPLKMKHCFVGLFVLPILMSGIIELLQSYATTCRSGDWWDMAANTLGVVAAWCIFAIIIKKRGLLS